MVGWTAGAGVEAAFTDNLTARIEYLFVDFSDATFTTGPAPQVKLDANLIRLGLDYKFRGGLRPKAIARAGQSPLFVF